MDQGAPAGWKLLEMNDPFQLANGPFFYADPFAPTADEPFRMGFRVNPHNCNFAGSCHGGVIAAFLDIALGQSALRASGQEHAPTMTLTVDYLRAAMPGEWLESRVRILRTTRSVGFCDATLIGPNGTVARASGVFKFPSRVEK